MKKLILFFAFFTLFTNAKSQTLNSIINNQTKVVIGEFNQVGGTFAVKWSESQLRQIAQALYLDGTKITNASIKYNEKIDFWYINATGIRGEYRVTSAITLEKNGNSLEMVAGGCTQQCTSRGTCDCELIVKDKCKSIECNCLHGSDGCDSKITENEITVIAKLAAAFEREKIIR